jgi:transposase-like protein
MPTPAARRWEPIVRRARQSGLSIRAYARQHGVNESTLAWWNWRLGDELGPRDSAFVEVTLADRGHPLRLQVGRVQLEVDDLTDLALLRRVVAVLP